MQHCALNVALYGRAGHRWAMTERGRERVSRSHDSLRIGPSVMAWEGDALVVRIDEVTAPWPSRIRGVVRLHPREVRRAGVPADRLVVVAPPG